MMSLAPHLARAAQRAPKHARRLHVKNIHGGLQTIVTESHVNEMGHLPFSYRGKTAFFGKFAAFCTAAFSIPFGAVLYKRTPQA